MIGGEQRRCIDVWQREETREIQTEHEWLRA
jgi:hypothetical protein